MTDQFDLAIIGAGAAGLAAGIFAAESGTVSEQVPGLRIVLLDAAKKIGAKILVSGGGRCNVTHARVSSQDFHGSGHLIRNVLAAFTEQDCRRWFASLGVELKKEDTGKLFPVTDDAQTVLAALNNRCTQLGVKILTEHRVADIRLIDDGSMFEVRHARGQLRARRVVMAAGGRSLPRSGSDGQGWTILRRLGHTVTPTVPALVPLVLEERFFHKQLMGLSQSVELTTRAGGRVVDQRSGSLLWTHFGISGPVVMDASRFWTVAQEQGVSATLQCNFLPGLTHEEVKEDLLGRIAGRPKLAVGNLLTQLLAGRFAAVLCRYCHIESGTAAGQLRRPLRVALVDALTTMRLPVRDHRGWNFAEVTAGGVPLGEIDFRTMESKIVPGLHLAGELLDCDGRIGGFNFQWAWSSGYVAGRAAVARLQGRGEDQDTQWRGTRAARA